MEAVPFSQLDDAAIAAWQRLADSAVEPNPYHRPDFVRATVATGGDPLVLFTAEGDDWLACLPVARVPRWRRLQLPCLAPWDSDLAFVGTPLLHRDAVDLAAAGLARFIAGVTGVAALVIDPIDPDGAAGQSLLRGLDAVRIVPIVHAEWERAALRRRPESTYLQEAMSGKRRKELRRQRRALGQELGGEVDVVDSSADADAIDRFLALEASGWKGEQGTALASRPGGKAFFRSMCESAAAAGRLQLLSLQAGGHTAAMQVNLIDGGTMFCFKVAFDDALSRFGPGALLEQDAIEVFHASVPADLVDSCAPGDSELVNRMWPDRRRLQTLIIPSRTRRAALIGPNLAAARIGREVVRRARARAATARGFEPIGR